MFHSSNGLFFDRLDDGQVRITKTSDGCAPAEDRSNVFFTQTLSYGPWCSVVCSVSKSGEGNMRWYEAVKFHND